MSRSKEGTICFEPADRKGPTTGGEITDGKYRLVGDAAPLPGKKMVRISASRKTGRKTPAGPPSAPNSVMADLYEQYIPDIYNSRTTLNCEVVAQGPNKLDFHLKSP